MISFLKRNLRLSLAKIIEKLSDFQKFYSLQSIEDGRSLNRDYFFATVMHKSVNIIKGRTLISRQQISIDSITMKDLWNLEILKSFKITSIVRTNNFTSTLVYRDATITDL